MTVGRNCKTHAMTNEELKTNLSDLKKELEDLKSKKKDKWDKVGIIGSILLPFAIAAFGYFLSNSSKDRELQTSEKSVKVTQAELIQSFIGQLTDTTNPIKRQIAVLAISHAFDTVQITRDIVKIVGAQDKDEDVRTQARLSLAFPTVHEKDVLNEWVIKVDETGNMADAEKRLQEFKQTYDETNDNLWNNDIRMVRGIDTSQKWYIVIDAFSGPSDSVTVNTELRRLQNIGKSSRELQNTFGPWIDNGRAIYYDKTKFVNLYGKVE